MCSYVVKGKHREEQAAPKRGNNITEVTLGKKLRVTLRLQVVER